MMSVRVDNEREREKGLSSRFHSHFFLRDPRLGFRSASFFCCPRLMDSSRNEETLERPVDAVTSEGHERSPC